MVNYTKPETRKGMCDRKTIISLQQKNESIVIGKDDCGKLSWDHKYVLVLDFLDYSDTVCQVLLWYTLLTAYGCCCPLYIQGLMHHSAHR